MSLFFSSNCTGQSVVLEDGREVVEFTNLFNRDECRPRCTIIQTRDGSQHEKCTALIGYDDYMYTLPSQPNSPPIRLQYGYSWQLTCQRKLDGNIDVWGSVG